MKLRLNPIQPISFEKLSIKIMYPIFRYKTLKFLGAKKFYSN